MQSENFEDHDIYQHQFQIGIINFSSFCFFYTEKNTSYMQKIDRMQRNIII